MYNPKNIFKGILAGLFILLLTICPASAAPTADITLNLTIPEIISISAPPIAQFENVFSQGFVSSHTNGPVINQGNVNIDIFFQLQSNFGNGNTVLDLNQCPYTIQTSDKSNTIGGQRALYGQNYLFKSWLQPNGSYYVSHNIIVPQTTAAGSYTANATYTAIKAA